MKAARRAPGSRAPREGDAYSARAAQRETSVLWTLAACAALVALVLLAFQPIFGAGFVDWDDPQNFVDNARWRGLSREHLAWMATTVHMGHWQPLAWLTFGIDHAVAGPEPRALHATNVAWHAATAVAFLFLSRALLAHAVPSWSDGRRLAAAALAAALFGVHPLRCESVCWVTERRDVVSGFFFVLALLAWMRYAERGGRGAYALALAAQALSLLAKAWGVVQPVLFLLIDVALARRERVGWKRLLVEKLPFAALSLIAAYVNLRAHATATDAQAPWSEHGLATRALQAGYGVVFYTARTFLPLDLSPHYELPPARELATLPYFAAAAGAVALTAAAFRLRRSWPWLARGWLAFLVVIAPVSGLAQAGPQLVADRYTYLATLPFAIFAACALLHPRLPRAASVAGTAVLVLALVAATRAQSRVWFDSRSLWARALAHDPESGVANGHQAGVLLRDADATADVAAKRALLDRAAAHFERAFRRSQNPAHVVNAGGVVRIRAELEPEDRRAELVERALALVESGIARGRSAGIDEPRWRRTHAALLADLGRHEEARAELAAFVVAAPDDVVGRVLLARALEALGRPAEALPHRERAAELRPGEPESWIALGETLHATGDDRRAAESLARGRALAVARGDTALVERADAALRALAR